MLEAVTTAVDDRKVVIVRFNNLIVGACSEGLIVKRDGALASATFSWTFGVALDCDRRTAKCGFL